MKLKLKENRSHVWSRH